MPRLSRFVWCLFLSVGCVGEPDLLGAPAGPDASADAPPVDALGLPDAAPAADLPSPDEGRAPDAGDVDVGRPAPDAGPAGPSAADAARDGGDPADRPVAAPGADASAGCLGTGPSVTVIAPAADEAIETCSASEAQVFYDFVAAVGSATPLLSVTARWITPDGAEAPPPATLSAPPYRFRRQVGGPMTGAPPLAVFGVRGAWRFEVTATDRCGRAATASRNFSLTFTARRCPNP